MSEKAEWRVVMSKYNVFRDFCANDDIAIIMSDTLDAYLVFGCDTEKELIDWLKNNKGKYQLSLCDFERIAMENADLFTNANEIRQCFKGGDVVG